MVHRCQEVQAADLLLVQSGEFLPGGEAFLNRPLLMPLKRKPSLAGRLVLGR